MRSSFGRWRKQLEDAWPGYWKEWDSSTTFNKYQKINMEPAVIDALYVYIDEARLRRPESPTETITLKMLKDGSTYPGMLLDVRKVEIPILTEFERDWDRIFLKMGLLETVHAFGLHNTIKDVHKALYTDHFDNPAAATLYVHLDFLEHDRVPKGPEESGDFYYHGGYRSFTILQFTIWTKDRREYHTYVSHVQDQSSIYAIAVFRDLLAYVVREWGCSWKRLVTWADCGPHFRSSRFMGFLFKLVLESSLPSLEESLLFLFAEGHGKGPCDGQGGRVKDLYDQAAKRVLIDTLGKWCKELKWETDLIRDFNPSAPLCVFHDSALPGEMPQGQKTCPQGDTCPQGETCPQGQTCLPMRNMPPRRNMPPSQNMPPKAKHSPKATSPMLGAAMNSSRLHKHHCRMIHCLILRSSSLAALV